MYAPRPQSREALADVIINGARIADGRADLGYAPIGNASLANRSALKRAVFSLTARA
jgi:hypothetical protein